MIKAVIQLDGVKLLLVIPEHLRSRQLLRIIRAHPVLVVPSRGADPYRRHRSLNPRCSPKRSAALPLLPAESRVAHRSAGPASAASEARARTAPPQRHTARRSSPPSMGLQSSPPPHRPTGCRTVTCLPAPSHKKTSRARASLLRESFAESCCWPPCAASCRNRLPAAAASIPTAPATVQTQP